LKTLSTAALRLLRQIEMAKLDPPSSLLIRAHLWLIRSSTTP
jgi:hypothetical protein